MQDPVVGKRESSFTTGSYENETSNHTPKRKRAKQYIPTAYSPDLDTAGWSREATVLEAPVLRMWKSKEGD